jgi:anti-sigma B factor antagonist
MQSILVRPQVATQVQVAVVCPVGQLSAASAAEFQTQLTAAILSEDNTGLAVDMSEAEMLDSAGLMALVSGLSLAQRRNKRFSLCSVSASIRIIFELTQLDRAFEIFDTIEAFERAIA